MTSITATQASDATHLSNFISADLTVNSVSVLTKNGQISTTDIKYVNKNGALGTSTAVDSKGAIIEAKTAVAPLIGG